MHSINKTVNNSYLTLKQSIKNIYEFYSDNIIKQVSGSLVSALPLFNHIYDSIDGLLDIVRKPYDNYNKNESVIEGLVQGVGSWVVKTATIFTYLGENIGNIFSFKGCVGNKEENLLNKEEYSTCRQLRYLFNETPSKKIFSSKMSQKFFDVITGCLGRCISRQRRFKQMYPSGFIWH